MHIFVYCVEVCLRYVQSVGLGHLCVVLAEDSLGPAFEPQQRMECRGDETNRRTRAKPQWIVGQAYSHTYSTLSQLSRLQTICLGDSSKFRFTDKSFGIMRRDLHPHYLNHGAERLFLCMYHRPKRCFPAWILTQRRSVIILQMVASRHWQVCQRYLPII